MTRALEPITVDRIDVEAAKVVRRLLRHGHEAYLVGGCVRDLLVGRTPKDFDVATDATPNEIRQIFRNSRIIGRRFRLVHIFFGPKIIETATFRSPPQPNSSGADPLIWQDNEFGTAEEDARRRDFTINGLFYDVASGKVIDWVGGTSDLRAGLVRTIGEANLRMQEDPVRILRAVMFSARLGFDIAPETREAMVTHGALIARCSVARVLEEIYKLLRGGAAAAAFQQLQTLGVLGVLFPELAALFADPQQPAPRQPALRAGRRRWPRRDEALYSQQGLEAVADHDDDGAGELDADHDLDDDVSDDDFETDHDLDPDDDDPDDDDADDDDADDDDDDDADDDDDGAFDIDEQALAEQLLQTIDLHRPEQRVAASALLWGQLAALDSLVARLDVPPYPPLLLGALLTPLASSALQPDRRMGTTAEQVDALVRAVSLRLQVSRRHRDRLKQIIVAQRRLTQSRPRASLLQRDYFQPALQLLELRQLASGERDPSLAPWDELLGQRKRRRRRRRKKQGDTQPTELQATELQATELQASGAATADAGDADEPTPKARTSVSDNAT